MSIKASISLFLLMMGVSFSASASYCHAQWGGDFSYGDIVHMPTVLENNPKWALAQKCEAKVGRSTVFMGWPVGGCKAGDSVNPSTGKCEAPPVCEPPSQLDPDTLECVTLLFCERDSTNEELFSAEQSCAAEGGIFSYECSDFLESLETRCTQSDQCAIGFPNWPACMDDLDPTDDITPPSGGFNPGSGPTANPDGPTFDKPEPDDVTPTDTTDEAVLKAVQNANRDSNEGFKALSTDLNKGFTDTNNALSKLNATNTAIGESVVEQMNQDYEIYQANKDLALQQTGAITAGASNITNALGSQTGALTGALGDQTDALTGALGELSEKLTDDCEPSESNNWCQYPHGLGEGYIRETFGQMDNQVDGIVPVVMALLSLLCSQLLITL